MRKLKTLQIKARKPKDKRFGDFIITEVKLDEMTAKADFGDGAVTTIDISKCVEDITKYQRTKTFYARMV